MLAIILLLRMMRSEMNTTAGILIDGKRLHKVPATFHADASLWSYQEHLYVIKQIGQRYTHFSHEAAVTLVHLLRDYYQSLFDLHIPVPGEFECWVDDEIVFCVSRYCGKSLRALAETCDTHHVTQMIEAILAMIAELFHANGLSGKTKTMDSSWLTLSLDVSPDNFTLDDARTLRYVDFTPPLLKMQRDDAFQEAFIPIVQRDEHPMWKNFRYFHRMGVMLTFLTKFWAAWPQHSGILHECLARFLNQPCHQGVLSTFQASLAIQVYRLVQEGREARFAGHSESVEQKRSALHRLISGISAAERDQLRLCVLLLTPVQLELITSYLGKYHELLASAHENHARFFQAVFACYKSSHTHNQLQHLVMFLVDLALVHHPDLAFRQFNTALLSLLLPSS
jgi:hypothetical protein